MESDIQNFKSKGLASQYNKGKYLINSLCSVDRVDDVESRLFLGVGFDLDEDIGSNLTVLS